MPKIESQSQRTNSALKSFFVPSFIAGILFFLLGTVLLLAYNVSQIVNWVGSNYLDSSEQLKLNISVLNTGFSRSFDSALGGRLGQIIVWSLVGAISYMALWLLKNLLNSFENDLIIDHYSHPSNFNRTGYWGSAMAGIIFFGAMVILVVAYTFITLKVIMPGVAALDSSAINDFHVLASTLYIVLCVFISAAVIYVWTLTMKLLSHLWKLL